MTVERRGPATILLVGLVVLATGEFRSVEVDVSHDPEDSGKVKVRTVVAEK